MSSSTMSKVISSQLIFNYQRSILVSSQRYQRGPFGKPKRTIEDRYRQTLKQHENWKLKLAEPIENLPNQWKVPGLPKDPTVLKEENKLLSLTKTGSPYHVHTKDEIKQIENFGTFYDPLFNPHLHEERNKINPDEEPFNAIYVDSQSERANDYTKVRNITSPELWEYVERLARIKIPPRMSRKSTDPPIPLPSGFIPPPDTPPDLPYFIARTRNYLLPVYYHLGKEPDECYTMVSKVTGDMWQLEEDLRTHLESIKQSKRRILTSVQEPDHRVLFRGRHLHEVVEWLQQKGF